MDWFFDGVIWFLEPVLDFLTGSPVFFAIVFLLTLISFLLAELSMIVLFKDEMKEMQTDNFNGLILKTWFYGVVFSAILFLIIGVFYNLVTS